MKGKNRNCINCRYWESTKKNIGICDRCLTVSAFENPYPKWKRRTLIQKIRDLRGV